MFGFGKKHEEPGAETVYAVGSPEYNAQIVAALQKINGQLALQGKRVPERAAIEIIESVTGGSIMDAGNTEPEPQEYYCGLCGQMMPVSSFPHPHIAK